MGDTRLDYDAPVRREQGRPDAVHGEAAHAGKSARSDLRRGEANGARRVYVDYYQEAVMRMREERGSSLSCG